MIHILLEDTLSTAKDKWKDNVLEKLFSMNYRGEIVPIKGNMEGKISKRFIGLLAGAGLLSGISSLIWSSITYATTQSEMNTLREEMRSRLGYVEKVILEDRATNMANFIAIRREVETLGHSINKNLCDTTRNMIGLISHYHFMPEFDDMFASLHHGALTSKIVPEKQIIGLVQHMDELQGTLYRQYPFLLYSLSRVQFSMMETDGGFLRGVLTIPIIKRSERVFTHFYLKHGLFYSPMLMTEHSNRGVHKCLDDMQLYLCKEQDLHAPATIQVRGPYMYLDGLIIINSNTPASVTPKGN